MESELRRIDNQCDEIAKKVDEVIISPNLSPSTKLSALQTYDKQLHQLKDQVYVIAPKKETTGQFLR